jgi:hypothetical protein
MERKYKKLTQRERDLINWRNDFGLDLIDAITLMNMLYEQAINWNKDFRAFSGRKYLNEHPLTPEQEKFYGIEGNTWTPSH